MNGELVTIIGSGPLSLSLAVQFASAGKKVSYVDLGHNEALKEKREVKTVGIWSTSVTLDSVCFSLNETPECSTIVVAVSPSRYDEVFPYILRRLKAGMSIIFFPASFGAMRFSEYASKAGIDIRDVTIAEAVSFPFVCSQTDGSTLLMQSQKSELRIAVQPKEKEKRFIDELNSVFHIFSPARNFIETSLDNMNMTLHPLPVLLNVSAIEKNRGFRHYIDGVSPLVGRMMDALDAERLKIGKAVGVELTSALQQLKLYYGESNATNLFEYVSREDGPYNTVGCFGFESRYIREDIPFLLVPAIRLANEYGVAVPTMNLCVKLADTLLGTDYMSLICR